MTESRPDAGASSYVLTRDLFLRLVGFVYLTAFLSLRWQIVGLLGEDGILPAQPYLERAREVLGAAAPWRVPTVFWLGSSDAMLHGVCVAGAVASLLLIAGAVPLVALATCWFLYLSLVSVGQTFLAYQWDGLLLETGFLAWFWAPLAWRLGAARAAPSPVVLWLLRWLLFRLMFFSGFVKLASGDPTWWELRALEVHYETQPLPTWTSWYAHLLPSWLQRASCAVMFVIELVLPFFIVLGRRARAIAFAGLVALQLAIAATGNYGFFNLLSIVLCVPLLDDAQLGRVWPRALRPAASRASVLHDASPHVRSHAQLVVGVALAIFLALLTLPLAASQLGARRVVPAPLAVLLDTVAPFRLTSTYGLFAVMTTTRPELTLEGSLDGVEWRPYRFRWKPGPLDRAPSFAGTNMPRLDWQMWFDALHVERMLQTGRSGANVITPALLTKLRSGSRSVLDLLDGDPFDGQPPRELRWRLDDYRFTDRAERAASGRWWERRLLHEQAFPTPP